MLIVRDAARSTEIQRLGCSRDKEVSVLNLKSCTSQPNEVSGLTRKSCATQPKESHGKELRPKGKIRVTEKELESFTSQRPKEREDCLRLNMDARKESGCTTYDSVKSPKEEPIPKPGVAKSFPGHLD